MEALIIALALSHAPTVSPQTALSIARVESNLDHSAVSPTNDHGLFQLNARYFTPTPHDAHGHIITALKHLEWTKRHCPIRELYGVPPIKHVDLLWVVCYNLGVNGIRKIKEPWNQTYFMKVVRSYNENMESKQ